MLRIKSIVYACFLFGFLIFAFPSVSAAYQIQPGDSLWSISQRYNVPVSRLEEADGLSGTSVLRIGRELTIPGQRILTPPTQGSRRSVDGRYSVRAGDTLWSVAERYGTSIDTLVSINGLTSAFLQVGQTLRVPDGTSSPTRSATVAAYGGMREVSRDSGSVDRLVAYALQFQGVPYVWGGDTPNGFDCSGFVQYVYHELGINLPRTTWAQNQVGVPVSEDQLQQGDLVFFNTYGPISHVGIYVGNGQFISSTSSGGVSVKSLNDSYWGPRYAGARRL